MPTRLNGTALVAIGAGSVLLYSGITGKSVLRAFQTVIQGGNPASLGKSNPIAGSDAPAATASGGAATGAVGKTFGNYNHAALEQIWVQNGGDRSKADIAAAVAQAESGGNPGASNKNSDGSIDRGLWQINSVHGSLSVFDPAANARAAIKISSNGTNWSPWVTYNTGAYRKYL